MRWQVAASSAEWPKHLRRHRVRHPAGHSDQRRASFGTHGFSDGQFPQLQPLRKVFRANLRNAFMDLKRASVVAAERVEAFNDPGDLGFPLLKRQLDVERSIRERQFVR